jgi:pimeloyl-ACP methyl ester carboxylesterase
LRRVLVFLAATLACTASANASAATWVGSYRLPSSADPVEIAVVQSGSRVTVALGPGHAGRQVVRASATGGRLRFALPGRPAAVTFDGQNAGGRLTGSVRQGSLHGTFTLGLGTSRALPALGLYRSSTGAAAAIVQAEGLPTWLVELPSGDVHGLNRPLTTVGRVLGQTSGDGTLAIGPNSLAWTRNGQTTSYQRVAQRQEEVRVGAIAATLTVPSGPGPFPAVVMTHGSSPQTREEFQVFAAYCELLGIAVIADDKRGIGQSGGTWPGERATPRNVDLFARDAQAEARFLRSLRTVDPKRLGVLGDSQAGWVIALAAAREPAFRWAVPLAGPTTTVDETDNWGTLAGKGQTPPAGSFAEILQQVRTSGPGGFDPRPSLARLSIPVHWVFADDDRNVPTELCIERLQKLAPGHDFTWSVIHATHTLFELSTSGLNTEIPRSRGFGAGLFSGIGDWLRARSIVTG